jgi:hypothetical protein
MDWDSKTWLGTVKPGLGQRNLAWDNETWLGTVKPGLGQRNLAWDILHSNVLSRITQPQG